jgi:predicted ATP-grasp superfamily ATP-dependent carboligase
MTDHPETLPPNIFIIGASTRALADMAFRLGLKLGAFDQYADFDLAAKAAYLNQIDFDAAGRPMIAPRAFRELIGKSPWIYTGPLENQPGWLEEAAHGTHLWGNPTEVNRRVRDPFALSLWLDHQQFGINMPPMNRCNERPKILSKWLFKQFAASGGWDLVSARKAISGRCLSEINSSSYWQMRIKGPAFGWSLASDGRQAAVLGVCRSLHGAPGRPFAYSGSAGPVCSRQARLAKVAFQELATALTQEFGLRGLWNIDTVYDPMAGKFYLIEINPRPSASMEVLELAAQKSILAIHLAIFQQSGDDWLALAGGFQKSLSSSSRQVSKRILYAKKTVQTPRRHLPQICMEKWPELLFFADIPHPGTRIPPGYPITTLVRIQMA